MSEIRIRENESLESALRRFKRQCARAGVIAEVRKREHYEKPSVRRKKKAEAANAGTAPAPAVLADEWVGHPCPLCGKGTIIKGKTAYGCSEWRNGCTFRKPFDA